jgi:hypothetical protein
MRRVLVPFAAFVACSVIIPLALVAPFPGPHASASSSWIDHLNSIRSADRTERRGSRNRHTLKEWS